MELVTTDLHGANGEIISLLTCSGDLDIDTSDAFKSHVLPLLAQAAQVVVVNMESVLFVDSTGISAMIACFKAAEAAGSQCRFVITAPKVTKTLATTGVDQFLTICDSTDSALNVI